MTVTFQAWVIPALCSAGILFMMFRPYRRMGDYDFGEALRVLWLIPFLAIWLIYFIVLRLLKP